MRKDIMSVLELFGDKGYACGYLTTNGTIITDERAEALADLAAAGFLNTSACRSTARRDCTMSRAG